MKINKFERPQVPNFIMTDKGQFDIADFTPEEINLYISIWREEFLINWQIRKKIKKVKK